MPRRFPPPASRRARRCAGGVWRGGRSAPLPLADQVRQQEWWLSELGVSAGLAGHPGQRRHRRGAQRRRRRPAARPGRLGDHRPGLTPAPARRPARIFGVQGTRGRQPHRRAGAPAQAAHSGIIGDRPRGPGSCPSRVTLTSDDPLLDRRAAGAGLPDAIASGIRYAVGTAPRVIDLPLDPGRRPSPPRSRPLPVPRHERRHRCRHHRRGRQPGRAGRRRLRPAQGVVLVAPAGDNARGTGPVNYPAAYPGVISVGAADRNQVMRGSSNQPYVQLTAPGAGVIAAAGCAHGLRLPDGQQHHRGQRHRHRHRRADQVPVPAPQPRPGRRRR